MEFQSLKIKNKIILFSKLKLKYLIFNLILKIWLKNYVFFSGFLIAKF
jgi:hypothetical protein